MPSGPLRTQIPFDILAEPVLLDVPPDYLIEAGLFAQLAFQPTIGLAKIVADQRVALLSSMSATLHRAAYHVRRFQQYVDAAHDRFQRNATRIVGDGVARCVLFEAIASLSAERTFVDELVFVGGQRAGESIDDSHKRTRDVAATLRRAPSAGEIPEMAALASRKTWFEELTDYRNAIVHRGCPEVFGFVPRHSLRETSDDPAMNVALIPDRTSLRPPNRPFAWTYAEGARLEDLMSRSFAGTLELARDIAALWGTAVPVGPMPPDVAQRAPLPGNEIVLLPVGVVATRKRSPDAT